jgi:hypothetical protein
MLLKKIRLLVLFFILALILSGITAFPVETELKWLLNCLGLTPLLIGRRIIKQVERNNLTN